MSLQHIQQNLVGLWASSPMLPVLLLCSALYRCQDKVEQCQPEGAITQGVGNHVIHMYSLAYYGGFLFAVSVPWMSCNAVASVMQTRHEMAKPYCAYILTMSYFQAINYHLFLHVVWNGICYIFWASFGVSRLVFKELYKERVFFQYIYCGNVYGISGMAKVIHTVKDLIWL